MAAPSLVGIEETSNYKGVSVRAATALTASYVYTNEMDVRLFEAIDWLISLTAIGNITRVDIIIQWSVEQTPTDSDWATLQAESIGVDGSTTISDYVIQKTISSITTIGISCPVRGRWMRIGIKAGIGSPVGSSCSIKSLRRKPRTN